MSENGTSTERVTFSHAFLLPGFDRPHRPGSFDVLVEREALDVSWPAYRLTLTIVLTNDDGSLEAIDVTRDDLEAALLRDRERQ
jgi:hypothetical protein